jgi:hypothetical protein
MHIARNPMQRWAVPCWRSETPRIAAHATNHISSTCPQQCLYCYAAMQLLQHASKGYGGIAALIAALRRQPTRRGAIGRLTWQCPECPAGSTCVPEIGTHTSVSEP